MPTAPLTVCTAPGCGVLVQRGRCERHRAERHRDIDSRRGTRQERGYGVAWQRLRVLVLQGEPLCRECGRRGELVPATEVDHIRPMAAGGAQFDVENLQPLCHACHSAKTMRESVIR